MKASNSRNEDSANSDKTRLSIAIRGVVQGVGFRPFVHRLAAEHRLNGWVKNSAGGVSIQVEGHRAELNKFLTRMRTDKPPRSSIQSIESTWLPPVNYVGFEILESDGTGPKSALASADIAMCTDCLHELFDPADRRYRYPFTNCTNCGPRFSIMEALPYDRATTSMKAFTMCRNCRAEYEDPADRRFHAQPNACPRCGPRLQLWNPAGETIAADDAALLEAVEAVRRSQIVAVKGLGGFQLIVAANDEDATRRLRARKHREEKPFALMFPSLDAVKRVCELSAIEERVLCSPESPIVLLRRRDGCDIAPSIAPSNPNLGVMLPYTPLHHLLMSELKSPIVATSGNLSDEPICTDEFEVLKRLGGIADLFLVHNRPILRHMDDSIVRVMLDRELVLRRARGYAPFPITLKLQNSNPPSVLGVGAHLKNTVALTVGSNVFISQHIGDLETVQANVAFTRAVAGLEQFYEIRPRIVAADLHPDYISTKFARQKSAVNSALELVDVQHHMAHVLSCMAENELEPPVLGVAWDGTGYGIDGTVWGGEFFLVSECSVDRVAHFRQFRLPGGDQAVREPRRAALGLAYEIFGDRVFNAADFPLANALSVAERKTLGGMLRSRTNSPLTSSVGRLFDAVAALIGLRPKCRFEGQAAMELEFSLHGTASDNAYQLPFANHAQTAGSPLVLDWELMVKSILADVRDGVGISEISAKFHNTLVEALVAVAHHCGQKQIALSGGCFQNRYLTERAVHRLEQEGFSPYWHQRVPPNDGGVALGQVAAALRHTQAT